MTNFADDELRWSLWMAQAQRGDEQAYRNLLHELKDTISAYLHSRFGRIDIIEDCIQECLITLHEARHTYDSARPFRPWLFAIVRHKTIDLLRRQRTYSTALTKAAIEEPATTPPVDINDQLAGARLLQLLSTRHREALTLTKLIGFSMAEAANKVGISETAMKVRVYRAVGATRKILEQDAI